jgi:Ion transport protein
MLEDILNFIWLYLICTLGFGITLWGLFNHTGNNGYSTVGFSFIQLFAASLGNPSFSIFMNYPPEHFYSVNGTEYPAGEPMHAITNTGIVVYIVFVGMVGIVLINMLIARMSSTHDRLDASSKAQWGFMMVSECGPVGLHA